MRYGQEGKEVRNETKWSKTNTFAYVCFHKFSIRVIVTRNNNVYKTICKNKNKEHIFMIWNLKSAITFKCGQIVLSHTSVYFPINKLILLFLYSFYVPCIIFSKVYVYFVRSMFPFLVNRSQSKASIVNKRVIFILKLKNIFLLISTYVQNNIASTLSNVETKTLIQRCKFWRWQTKLYFNVDLTLSNVVASYHPNNNVETTLKCLLGIEECCFVKFIKFKTYMFSRISLNCCF